MQSQSHLVGPLAAHFIAAAPRRQYSDDVLDRAKMCLVDWMGVALGAHEEGAATTARKVAESWATEGRAQILLGGQSAPAVAALVNGTMSHCFDYDDAHTVGGGHVSAPNWAAALAMGGHLGASERDILGAFITGFEVMARLGSGGATGLGRNLQLKGFHPTSVLGRFGAAAVACALLGLSEERTAHALGVAATTAGGLNASFGTMSKPFHAGKAAMDGILAAQLAAEGFEAATNLLDAENGLAGTLVQDRSGRIPAIEFSEGGMLEHNAFKPYACCRGTHPAVDAARQLAAQVGEQQVERVKLRVHKGAQVAVSKPHPKTPLEGKFSFPFTVALALRGHKALFTDFTAERLNDPRIRSIMPKVEVEEVEESVQPRTDAHIEVTLQGGKRLEAHQKFALGHPQNPMSWGDMEAKFFGLVDPVLGKDARSLLKALRSFEQPGRLGEVLKMVAR
ncbi:MAG: MmgE/PrpD family protein [Candidatus Lambdaproteobacteria bacterium]|nr:MmgE/PrpD family protein [Candidatus Lambdaproteobacteria bacterium]